MSEKGIRFLFLVRKDVFFKTQQKELTSFFFFLSCLFVFDELVSHGKKADITFFFICLFFALIKKFSSVQDDIYALGKAHNIYALHTGSQMFHHRCH